MTVPNSKELFDFQQSLQETPTHQFLINSKQYHRIESQNTFSQYSTDFKLDLTPLSNSGVPISYTDGFLYLPMYLRLTTNQDYGLSSDGTDAGNISLSNAFALSLKNGIQQCLSNILIKYNNNTINQNNSSGMNFDINWKMLQMSDDKLQLLSEQMLFSLDDENSVRYNASGSALGLGECNNNIAHSTQPLTSYTNCYTHNKGRLERMKQSSFNPTEGSISNFTSTELTKTVLNNFVSLGLSDQVYIISGIIPLSILHPFFESLGICRGAKIEIELGCNTGNSVISINAGVTYGAITSTNYIKNSTCPFMISGLTSNNGLTLHTSVTGITVSCGIGHDVTTSAGNVSYSTYTKPAIFIPKIHFNEDYLKQLLLITKKTISYCDYYVSTSPVVSSMSSLNYEVNSTISRARQLVIIPITPGDANINSVSCPLSPFSSQPMTTAAYAKISNLQIEISGVNQFDNTKTYSFENYEYLKSQMSVNGASMNSLLSSGQITKSMFDKCYSYYAFDISNKKSPEDDNISRSIKVNFTNLSSKSCQYVFLLYFEKRFNINPTTSEIIA